MILHYFALEHIPASGVDLVSAVSPRMLKWEATPQYKTLRATQKAFSSASKVVIVELKSATTPSVERVERRRHPKIDS